MKQILDVGKAGQLKLLTTPYVCTSESYQSWECLGTLSETFWKKNFFWSKKYFGLKIYVFRIFAKSEILRSKFFL